MIRALVPMAHVQDVSRSIAFYEKLGFRAANVFTPQGATEPSWASVQSDRAELMVARGEKSSGSVLFYLYCDDVSRERERLQAAGIRVGEITYAFYAPRGEFRVEDPDGYVLMITHT
jgi:catechol 2,3-dioxygenase-like lactoylglutathione lyase family enzyme